jgi:hypothetical protein
MSAESEEKNINIQDRLYQSPGSSFYVPRVSVLKFKTLAEYKFQDLEYNTK